MRTLWTAGIVIAALAIGSPAAGESASAGGPPQFITYGVGAHPQEGDPDRRQAFYFTVPANFGKPLYVRLFDPESGGKYDQITTRGPNTTTRFTVFGGKGADASRFARLERISHQEEILGTPLLRKEFKDDPELDDAWTTLGSVMPEQGELVEGRYLFRLLVHGLGGHDGNVFDFAISTSETENIRPEGMRLYTYGPTTRTPIEGMITELRFKIPDDAESLTVGTFDGAAAEVLLQQRFQQTPLNTSGQNEWKTTPLVLTGSDRGTDGAITLQGGDEVPNDATFYVANQDGKPVPFDLPVRLLTPKRRPIAIASSADGESCMAATFDGAASYDPDNAPITHRWHFGDGETADGPRASHVYEIEGLFGAWLEVTNDSDRVGNGARARANVFVKRPPVARSVAPKVVAVGEDAVFDGNSSTASYWQVERHEWRMSDGAVLTGDITRHVFRKPGTYKITHLIEDNSGHRCNTDSEEFEIRVNAPPVAQAGPAQRVTASLVQFDGSASSDPDGDSLIRYEWDFGDGTTGSGVRPSHVYASPGTYEVRLTVTDSAGVPHNSDSSTVQIVVNARPIADAGPELVGAPGQTLTFDGSRSVDPDGTIAEYSWDFRDGTTASGQTVSHAFAAPGVYKVRLRVRDDTGQEEAVDFHETRVFINEPPVADAGPPVIAGPGDEVKLTGARTFDRDGAIASYRWDFSDRPEPMQGAEIVRTFEKPGIYTVKLTVTDNSGAINATSAAETRIAINHAPVADAGADIETNELTIAFDGSRSVDADGDPLTYSWDFGDGTRATGARVSHTYKDGGSYAVILTVRDGKNLHNSESRDELTVRIDRPPVAIAGENRIACTDETLVFDGSQSRDPEGGVLRHLWDFGDGTTSEDVSPSKIYRRGGHYPVKLTVRDDSGMERNVHSDRISVQVDQRPIASISPRQILACTNTEVVFDGATSTDVDDVVNSYRWDFGDGNFGGGVRPTHIYEKPGNYRAFLTIRGEQVGQCSDTSRDEIPIEIIQGPLATIGAPAAAPVGHEVAFDGSGSHFGDGKITGWRWDFGDGTTADGAKVSHQYAKAGIYRVTLTVTSDSESPSCRAVSSRHVLTVNAAPQASFTAKPLAAVGEEVLFDASASLDPDGSLVGYVWDFGDGTTGNGVAVRHRYGSAGTYKVKLTVEDNLALPNSTSTTELAVRVNAAPVANAGSARIGAPGQSLRFDGAKSTDSDGSITEYSWSFGDGTTATGKAVAHTFVEPGVYTVRLRVKDDSGHAAAYGFHEVPVVINQSPVANAGPAISAGPGDEVRLSGTRSFDADGKITGYRWEFSDGGASLSGAEVVRTFDKPGIYTATLTVTDDSGAINASTSAETRIEINHAPVAVAGTNVETNQLTINFDAGKSSDADGDTLIYSWNFGDGTTATGVRAIHTFKDGGVYPIVLTVNDGRGLHNSERQDSITVRIDRAPVALAGENRTACTGDTLVFDGGGSKDPEGGVLRYLWDFGDGIQADIVNPTKSYRKGGHYPITLTVRDDSGMEGNVHTDRISVQIDQGPVATIAQREVLACARTEVLFDGSGSTDVDGVVNNFRWDFGDGNFGGGERAAHIYEKPGDYRAFLTILGEKVGNCSNTSTDEIPVTIIAGPVAAIKAPSAIPVGADVTFDGSGSHFSDGKITGWSWDFGDGNTATGPVVTHQYAKSATYRVTLTVTSNSDASSCQAVSSRHLITANDAPQANFTTRKLVAANEEVLFDASSSRDLDGGIAEYAWEFGDGGTASGVSARHIFRTPGLYQVRLTVRDNAGLPNSSHTMEQTVRVNAPPAPVISGPEVACVNEAVAWNSEQSKDPDGEIRSYQWVFGDGASSNSSAATHRYGAPGRYSLTLLADDGAAVANSRGHVTRSIRVNRPPRAVANAERLVCPGDVVKFDGSVSSDADGKLTRYHWNFGDGASGEGMNAEHRFDKPGTYEVRLTVTDDSGSSCAAHTDTINVLVKAPPVARAGGDREIRVGGANDGILLDGSKSSDPDGHALNFEWRIGDAVAAGERVRHAVAAPGEYEASLTVSDTSGLACGRATDTFRVIARERK